MEEEKLTVEEKYALAKMVLMLIERLALSVMAGHIPPQDAAAVLASVGNMAHVANHVNGEITFDCGPDAKQHHAEAIGEYTLMYAVMLQDIRNGTDYSQMKREGKGIPTKGEVDFNEVEPVKF